MARVSTKENKNIYQLTREGLKLTRDAASELLESIPPERIEKIENERSRISVTTTAPTNAPSDRSMYRRSRSRICPRLFWKCWPPSTP